MVTIASPPAAAERKPRWYRLTPERYFWAVLLLEVFLWLSERFRWFSFNETKNLTIFIALAVLFVSLLGFAVRFLSAWVFRHRFQFGIRTLLLLTITVAIPFSWLAVRIERAQIEYESVWCLGEKPDCNMEIRTWLSLPNWMSNLLGEYFFTHVNFICDQSSDFSDEDFMRCCELADLESCTVNGSAVTDAGLENIGNLTRLKYLDLRDTPITDAGLKHLEKLHQLEKLDLTNTNTTEAALQELQTKLPHCKISW